MPNADCPDLTSDVGHRPTADAAYLARHTLPWSHRPAPGRPLSVVVVNDGDDAGDRLARTLERHGFMAMSVTTCADAMTAVVATLPDVAILYLPLVATEGWALAQQICAGYGPTAKRPFLVAVTACGSEEDGRRAAEAGVDLVLVEPVEPAVVVGVLRRFARALALGREPPRTIDAS